MIRINKKLAALALVSGLSVLSAVPTFAGWQNNKQGYWYETSNGNYYTNCWKSIDGKWYHFDQYGYMQTGWFQDNGKWYYLNLDGSMLAGWQFINGHWYYLNPSNGQMMTGWLQLGHDWYYLNNDGSMRTGWFMSNNAWYLLNTDGKMLTGWQKVGNDWYYLNESGVMLTGQQYINNGYYLLGSDGHWLDSSDNRSLIGPTSGVEATTTLEANMSTAKIRGLANYYYDLYYNDINAAFAYVNDLRDNGHKLNYSESLSKAATCHAIDMVSHNYFGHDLSSTSDIVEWQYWAKVNDSNIDGECIVHDATIKFCIDSLAASDENKKNLTNTAYTTAGVGLAKKPNGDIYMAIMLQK